MTNFRKVLTTILAVVIVGIKTELILAEGTAGTSAASVAQANASGANPGGIAAAGSADNLMFTGSFAYSYPIVTPPGLAGMQPAINLQYNSSSNYGWLGVGWNLSLGAIQRSTKNGIPKYDASDIFVVTINGESLELVKIADGTYRAKIESGFRKFILGANGWTVYDKFGTQYFFGTTSQARLDHTLGTYLWALEKTQDRNGNYFTVSYSKPSGDNQIYLQQVDYTGNQNAGLTPNKKVVFICETSPWVERNFSPGFLNVTTQRLKSVETYASGSLVWKYALTYATSLNSKRPLLQQIIRTGLDGTTKFPATTFEYQGSNQSLSFSGALGIPISDWTQLEEHIEPGDWNGDGKMDFVFHRNGTPGYGSGVYISNGDGTFQGKGSIPGSDWSTKNNFVTPGDFNGDGKTDMVVYRSGDSGFGSGVFISNGDGTFRRTGACPGADFSKQYTYVISADFNGDSLSDLGVYSLIAPGNASGIFLSNGDGTFRRTGNIPGSDWTQLGENVLTGDFNGDGRSDLALYRDGTPGRGSSIWFSNGDGTFTQKGVIPGSAWDGNNDRVLTVDLNRDNLTDLVVWREKAPTGGVSTGQFGPTVYFSKGDGNFLFYGSYFTGLSSAGSYMTAGDFNGDGYNDLAVVRNADAGYQGKILLNNGDGTFNTGFGIPGNDWTTPHNYVIPGDFTGDGKTDLIVYRSADSGRSAGVYVSQGPTPDYMSRITNGIGGETRMTYKPSTQFSNRMLPFPITLLDRITQLDGRCNPALNECETTQNIYQGGFYDIFQREFLGFSQVDGIDAQGNKTTVKYHQDKDIFGSTVPQNGFKGRAYLTQVFDNAGNPLASNEVRWEYQKPYPNVTFIRPRWTRNSIRDDVQPRETELDYYYDDAPTGPGYGNVITTINQGDIQVAGDETTQNVEYGENTGFYLLGLPKRVLLTNAQNQILSEEKYFYDGSATLGSVTNGNVTEIWKWLDKPTSRWLVSKSQYDAIGRPLSVADPKGNRNTYTYDANGFVATVTNAKNQTVRNTYDPKTGYILTETNINNQTTRYVYDALGRTTEIYGPLDTELPGQDFDYHSNLIGNPSAQFVETRTRVQNNQVTRLWNQSFYDGLGRVYRNSQTGIISETKFDNKGRIAAVSTPHWETPATAAQWTQTTYDALGREIRRRMPDQTVITTKYKGRVTTVENANGQVQTSIADAFGRVIERREPSNAVPTPTTYQYDLLGRLLQLTDSQSKSILFTYDSFGRKLTMSDPNAGAWSYAYDDVGNMITQTDPRKVQVSIQYDALNRPVLKKLTADPSRVTGQTIGGNLAAYTYDEVDPINRPYSSGKLTSIQDLSGRTLFYHDALGRVVRQVKDIDSMLYETKTSYDALNRITQLIYPNDQILNYMYDNVGRLLTIRNGDNSVTYASYPSYNALGQPLEMRQANGNTKTSYDYDVEKNILKSLKVETGLNGGTQQTLQQVSYTFDGIGNITKIADALVPAQTQTFAYDSLNRLVNAKGIYGNQNYAYDTLGNFVNKGLIGYKYEDPAHPSAVTQTYPNMSPAQDSSTLLSWNLDSSDNIHSFSGVVRNSTGSALNGIAVIMTGPIEIGVKTGISGSSATTPGGFLFRNIAGGGSSYALSLSSAGMNPSPLQYAYSSLNQDIPSQDFTLTPSTDPALNLTKLRVPRTAIISGTASEADEAGVYKASILFGSPFGGTDSTSTTKGYTALSGYSPKPDAADTRTQTVSPTLQPPPASLTGVIGPLFVTGRYKQGLSFNGAGDVFLFPNTESISPNAFTLMVWAKPSGYPSGANYATLIDKSTGAALGKIGNGYRIVLSSAGMVVFEIGQQTGSARLTGSQNVPLNKWSFITASFDGTTMKIYINGALDAQVTAASQPLPNMSNVHMGAVIDANRRLVGGSYFKGILDEPRIQGRAWSADEISAAYTSLGNGIATYSYDAAGNMVKKTNDSGVSTYAYDAQGRLRQVSQTPGTGPVSFVYDGDGGRVKKISPQGTTLYVGKLLEVRPDGSKIAHVFAGGTPICDIVTAPAQATPPVTNPAPMPTPTPTPSPTATPTPPQPSVQVYYYHSDHLGSIAMVTDSAGNKLQEMQYEPFGAIFKTSGTSLLRRKYTSQEEDPETGLYFYNARYYDPILGRFISPDPIVSAPLDPQNLNRYVYVRNNPLNYTDPSGNSWLSKSVKKASSWVNKHSVEIGVTLQVLTGFGNGVPFLMATEKGQNILAGEILIGTAVGATIATGGAASSIFMGALSGEIVGAYSAYKAGGSLLAGVVVGGAIGAATSYLGAQAATSITNALSGQTGAIISGAARGAIVGAGSGGVAGFAGGAGNHNTILQGMLKGGITGGAIGGAYGAYSYTVDPGTARTLEDVTFDDVKNSVYGKLNDLGKTAGPTSIGDIIKAVGGGLKDELLVPALNSLALNPDVAYSIISVGAGEEVTSSYGYNALRNGVNDFLANPEVSKHFSKKF